MAAETMEQRLAEKVEMWVDASGPVPVLRSKNCMGFAPATRGEIAFFNECLRLMAQNEWVKVEDREPEREGRYLIMYEHGRTKRAYIGDWLPGSGWSCLVDGVTVTHWREITLPEGGKE